MREQVIEALNDFAIAMQKASPMTPEDFADILEEHADEMIEVVSP